MALWPIQERAVDGVRAAIARGRRRILVTQPTGTGKTKSMATLIREDLKQGLNVALYTHRKLLLEQLSNVLTLEGLEHGIRAAGHFPDLDMGLQLCSFQTEQSRSVRNEHRELHHADRVYVDEAHACSGEHMRNLLDQHANREACIIGFTATPIGLGGYYEDLVVAGNTSDGRACGALVPARHFGCGEPDLRKIGRVRIENGEDLTQKDNVKAIMVPGIFGRVLEWFNKLNPKRLPTILFAPGVAESRWFAEQFVAAGITAAHIDGDHVSMGKFGEEWKSSPNKRQEVLDGSRDGRIRVLCNRFVLREGIDAPWLAHGILATVFGSLQSFIQSGGRLLRSHPSIETVTIQDHGGNWHRHGSLNADREWRLDDTAASIAGLRQEKLRKKEEKEPVCCPQCGLVLMSLRCVCGFVIDPRKKSRIVVQADGSLIEHFGDIYRPRKTELRPDTQTMWTKEYWAGFKNDKTFRECRAWFYQKHGYWPDETLRLMPTHPLGWFQKVNAVPRDELVQ